MAERTFIMIKPDGVQRGLQGEIIGRFERKGFRMVASKLMWVSTVGHGFGPLCRTRVPVSLPGTDTTVGGEYKKY